MGHQPKPLKIRAHVSLMQTPEVQALIAKGHIVIPREDDDIDLDIGPTNFRLFPETIKLLDVAVKGARARKFPKGAK